MILTGLHRKGQSNDRFRSKMYEVRRMMSGVYEGVFINIKNTQTRQLLEEFSSLLQGGFCIPVTTR